MTVEVETSQGLRSGSTVVEIRAGKALGLLPQEAKAQVELKGEAVAVELPRGETLFALLRTADNSQSLQRAITAALDPDFGGGAEGFLKSVPKLGASEMLGRSATLGPQSYPLLVRFRDPKAPGTVEQVHSNKLSASFGAGTELKSIRVQITNDPIPNRLASLLPWIADYASRRARLSGSSSVAVMSNNLADNLGISDFSTEVAR
jgi:hypothetical protein